MADFWLYMALVRHGPIGIIAMTPEQYHLNFNKEGGKGKTLIGGI